MSEFIAVTKDGETIFIHPLALADHKRLGWKEVDIATEAAEKVAAGEAVETPRQRKAREAAEKAAAGEQTPPEDESKG